MSLTGTHIHWKAFQVWILLQIHLVVNNSHINVFKLKAGFSLKKNMFKVNKILELNNGRFKFITLNRNRMNYEKKIEAVTKKYSRGCSINI